MAQGPPIGMKKDNPNLAKCDLCGDFHRKSHWEQERANCKKRMEARFDCRWCSYTSCKQETTRTHEKRKHKEEKLLLAQQIKAKRYQLKQ